MFSERRQYPRQKINRLAKVHFDMGALPRDCMVTDISTSGARLFSEKELPDKFQLVLTGEQNIRRACKVVWRLGGELGVTFIGAPT
jgi:hypothetical protein